MSVSSFVQLLLFVGLIAALAILVPRNAEVQAQIAALHLPSLPGATRADKPEPAPSPVERVVDSSQRLGAATGGAMTRSAQGIEQQSAATSRAMRKGD